MIYCALYKIGKLFRSEIWFVAKIHTGSRQKYTKKKKMKEEKNKFSYHIQLARYVVEYVHISLLFQFFHVEPGMINDTKCRDFWPGILLFRTKNKTNIFHGFSSFSFFLRLFVIYFTVE